RRPASRSVADITPARLYSEAACFRPWRGNARVVGKIQRASFGIVIGALLLVACGGGGPQLDARVLQLSVSYTVEGPSSAELRGDTGAASAGAEVECRLTTDGKPLVGEATANEVGAF